MKRVGLSVLIGAALLCLGVMLGLFAAGENAYKPMEPLLSDQTGAPETPTPAVEKSVDTLESPEPVIGDTRVNINTATPEELDALPGIGPVKAAAIIAWREENGPFRYPEQLLEVSGIGEKTLEGLLEFIRTE